MLRQLSLALAVTLAAALLGPRVDAQCTGFGSCSGGESIGCGTPPRIGTTWQVCSRALCNTTSHLLLLGGCGRGTPIPAPPACTFCSSCSLFVSPILDGIPWSPPCLSIRIPQDRRLVGVTLCVQDVCVFNVRPPCVCLSNAIRVTIQP